MVTLKKPTPLETLKETVKDAKSTNVQLNALVSPAFKKAVQMRAIEEGTTVNVLIERVVREYLDKEK